MKWTAKKKKKDCKKHSENANKSWYKKHEITVKLSNWKFLMTL